MDINAYAKLNLILNVCEKEPNGYHKIETVMVPIDLCDVLRIDVLSNSQDIIIKTNSLQIPTDENNILHKCITLFREYYNIPYGFNIHLQKNIPVAAGLGGESADAAAFMRFLNQRFSLKLSFSDVFRFGRLLGWDVPICYFQKTIYINDLSRTYEFINNQSKFYVLLVKPHFGILTKDAFKKLIKFSPKVKMHQSWLML